MGSSVNGLGVLSVLILLLVGGWTISPAAGTELAMCPPVTIEDLFPEPEEPETTTTTTPTSTTTTVPPTTTTPSSTTTTVPPTTTTVSSTSTTEPAKTTAVTEAPTTTSAPSTTIASGTRSASTTAPAEATTTTAPSTTAPTETPTAAPSTTVPPETTTTTEPAEPPCDTPFVYPMVFPLMGAGNIGSPFGASRDGGARHHLGNDIAAPTLQPILAVADGTVSLISGDIGISGHRIHIRHDDGWSSLYIHLNNDTAGTDDGNGIGVRPDLGEGDRVEAGQVIGWNGDSGNAESTEHHLHFELRDPSGTSVDPRASLEASEQVAESQFSGPFADLPLAVDDPDPLILLLSRGVPAWCGDGAAACPDEPAGKGEVRVWLAALLDLPPDECESDCGGVTEADLARAIAWDLLRDGYQQASWLADDLPDGAWSTPPRQPPAHPADLEAAEAHLILGGSSRCLSHPDEERELTRREAAEVVALYTGWTDVPYCPTNSTNR